MSKVVENIVYTDLYRYNDGCFGSNIAPKIVSWATISSDNKIFCNKWMEVYVVMNSSAQKLPNIFLLERN